MVPCIVRTDARDDGKMMGFLGMGICWKNMLERCGVWKDTGNIYIWKYNIFFALEMMNIGRIKHCTCGNKFQGICSKTLVI